MRLILLAALAFILLSTAGCRVDYDIDEVAPEEFHGDTHAEDAAHSHDIHECEETSHEESHSVHHDSAGSASAEQQLTEPGRHVHEAGERNHGTEWFFNQPWAARFIWDKMIRDSVILLVLAGSILFISRIRRRKS